MFYLLLKIKRKSCILKRIALPVIVSETDQSLYSHKLVSVIRGWSHAANQMLYWSVAFCSFSCTIRGHPILSLRSHLFGSSRLYFCVRFCRLLYLRLYVISFHVRISHNFCLLSFFRKIRIMIQSVCGNHWFIFHVIRRWIRYSLMVNLSSVGRLVKCYFSATIY